jgi:predicted N-formylglutamate amidohydrolase
MLRRAFRGHERTLRSHRGWDPGALVLARSLARALRAPLHAATISRLVVDLNRSPHHPRLFSGITRRCDGAARDAIIARHYRPYRDAVERAIAATVRDGRAVLHLSIHSFTPWLAGRPRRADIGLLYDPARRREAAFARRLRDALRRRLPGLRVRRNYPYRGTDDGLTTWLRHRYGGAAYAGIELELNQALVAGPPAAWADLRRALCAAVRAALAGT